MLWRVTLTVAVMFVGCMCSCAQADLMSKLILPRDYGVKLCGREFVRAVIFTCGGSRWRRSADLDRLQWPFDGDGAVDDSDHSWSPSSELSFPQSSSDSLADLLAVYGQQRQPQSPRFAAEQSVPIKEKRNFSVGVAGKCCSQGCTKNDIGRLC